MPEGRVTTYKQLAHAVNTQAYQYIGQVVKNNPDAPQVPCHRVVKANGKIGGYKGERSGARVQRKIALLQEEGVTVDDGRVVRFDTVKYTFD